MGDGAGRVELVIEAALLGECLFRGAVILVFEPLILARMLVQARIEVRIGAADIADVKRAFLVRAIQRVNARRLLGDFAVDLRRFQ